ncbi:elongation factor P [Fluviispira multicolorata]|uniref:Elongation factor P n=2 Tax=Fluviispira multicolorata TaxID=2654512 RepID=A0A833N810_9BACT|nr:elongation factor P [Fluviispira multicolorata]KAB8033521.1 elongation factor P [Fluviispira multicolorata]
MSSMYDTREFRRGLKVLINNDPWVIVDFQHVSPGKGAAFTRTKVKNLRTGQVVEQNIKSGDKLEKPDVEERNMQFLYADADGFNFMDTGNYEQISLTNLEVGDTKNYLIENSVIKVVFFNGKPIGVETDTFVELKVVETAPGVRGDTATGGSKPAKLETGLVVSVPFHINEGDILRVDTRENVYVDRVNRK